MKEAILILIGILFGGYASFVASRIVLFYQLKHDAFAKVELLSALINGKSYDFQCGYRLDRLLEVKAVEFYFYGHNAAYERCHRVANEIQAAFDRISPLLPPDNYDISTQKTAWLRELASCHPSLWALLRPGRSATSVVNFYLSKESDYVREARSDIERGGGKIRELL